MDLLIIVSNPNSAPVVRPLALACGRSGVLWSAFFTNDGVKALDEEMVSALATAGSAIACQESWALHMPELDCPIEAGSQTNNSALVSKAARVLSL